MAEKKKSASAQSNSAQRFVDIEEIRDGVIVLKNGGLRAILLASSLNFDLKSSEEQDAIILQYQNFINSLDFPLQIMIHSRRFNIKPYLEMLKQKESEQANELLRLQISEYRTFIQNLTEVSNIMSKFFYIVVPFAPVEDQEKKGVFNKMTAMFNPSQVIKEKLEFFQTYKNQLAQRVDHVIYGLSGTGIQLTRLETEELIELLYNTYNPSLYTTILTKNLEGIELAPNV